MKSVWRAIAVVLLFGVLITACAQQQGDKAPVPEGPRFTIGMSGSNSPERPYNINAKAVVEAAGGQFVTEPYIHTPEGSITLVKSLINAGCDGIILFPMSDPSLTHIAKLCEEAGVHWVITAREIRDPRIKQEVEASPYFAGMITTDEETLGYRVMESLGRQGATKLAVFTTGELDTTGTARMRGMLLAAKEYGVEVVDTIRNPARAEDVSSAIESLINAYPDLDAVVNLGTLFNQTSTVALNTIWDAGKADSIGFAAIDFEPDMDAFFDRDMISIAFGGHIPLDASLAAALLVNSLMGTPIKENQPVTLRVAPLTIRSGDELRRYYDVVENGIGIFSPQVSERKLFKWENPDITFDSFQSLIDGYGIDAVTGWRTEN